MTARVQGEPPADGGPLLFALSFLVVPCCACTALVLDTSPQYRPETALSAAVVVGAMILAAPWLYFSRSMMGLVGKAAAVGALALCIVLRLRPDAEMPNDDVMPIFFAFVGPMVVFCGGFLGVLSATAALVAFSVRQRARVAWLRAVMSVGHEYYGVVPLKREDRQKPVFLRYRAGDLGLCAYRPPGDYREPVAAEIVARVPRLF